MPLTPGTKLGDYEIVASIGAGGMGEVYRARDIKLGREVAIKVLPEAFARDRERRARFEREARVLASLNHPNIAILHGLEQSGDVHFLVMEMVPGETLAEKIGRRGLPIEEALPLLKQVAEALEAAHGKEVVHRDLKPANIKVTPEGRVKVLDFGLAKALTGEEPAKELSESPTITRDATQTGVILGTAAYMSPEQARGKAVDQRADIWAFGCVLYEALTGRAAFLGETVSDTIAAILGKDPEWEALPESVPPGVRALLRRCLRKDARRRLQHVGDARIEIEEAFLEPASDTATPTKERGLRFPLSWLAAITVVAALIAGVTGWILKPTPPGERGRYEILLPSDTALTRLFHTRVGISPDGRRIVYAAERGGVTQLYLRETDQFESAPIRGTEGDPSYVFFSPDGENIAFFDGGKLQKVSVRGGQPMTICEISSSPRGGDWGSDDTIVYGAWGVGLFRVSANGGTPEAIAAPDVDRGEKTLNFPQFLPGGKSVLYTVGTFDMTYYDDARMAVLSLETGERKTLLDGGAQGRYLPTGHLVYGRAGALMAIRFDLGRLEVEGQPYPVQEPVVTWPASGAAQFSISENGTLLYVPGPLTLKSPLVRVDRVGKAQPLLMTSDVLSGPRLSPGERQIALSVHAGNSFVALYDLEREALTRFTTLQGDSSSPVWSPDGERIAFHADLQQGWGLFWKRADGSGPAEALVTQAGGPTSWSPDGKLLAFHKNDDLWILPVDGDRSPRPFLETPYDERNGMFSPDGRFMAYTSEETGRREVYVQRFPGPGERRQISTEGGDHPRWNPQGGELFYRNGNQWMAVAVETEPKFQAGKPRLLFEAGYKPAYDVAGDGRSFLMIDPGQELEKTTQINIVLNWHQELLEKVPVK